MDNDDGSDDSNGKFEVLLPIPYRINLANPSPDNRVDVDVVDDTELVSVGNN